MKAICLPRRNRSSFWTFCSSRLTFFLKWDFLDDLVQSRSSSRVQHLKFWKILSRNGSRGLQFLQMNRRISTSLIQKHCLPRERTRTRRTHLGFESHLPIRIWWSVWWIYPLNICGTSSGKLRISWLTAFLPVHWHWCCASNSFFTSRERVALYLPALESNLWHLDS